MKEYKVLIVDDEINIAEGLRFLIERLLPECDVLGLALDGTQGYTMALNLEPDIILTDIQMPQLNGIEMMSQLRASGCQAQFIILSGYAEFEYARKAIALGAQGYIIKPVEEEELTAVFRRVCQLLANEKEQVRQLKDMKHMVNAYGLLELLNSSGERKIQIRQRLDELGFPLDCKGYICTIWEHSGKECEKIEFQQLLKQQADRQMTMCGEIIIVPFTTCQIILIMTFLQPVDQRILHNEIGKMRFALSEAVDACVNAGVSVYYQKPEGICQAYEEARCSLNYKVVKGSGSVIWYEDIRHITSDQKLVDAVDIQRLEQCIDTMDEAGCRQAIDTIFSKIEYDQKISLTDLQVLSLNLVLSGIRKIPFLQFQLNSYLGMNILSLESIAKFQTIEQLKNWINNMLKSMNELMLKEEMPEKKDLVEEIKQYMYRNFNKEISLNHISEKFYINPSYLSQLFKKKTGETYQNYLTGIRINRAKKLLEETDLKLYEICAMVGYSDTNYFNKIFERKVGMKPGEYRTKYEE